MAFCNAAVLAVPLTVHLGVEFTLAPGQGAETAQDGPSTTRVRFVRVIEDGRCPHDVNCAVTRPVGLEVEIGEPGRTTMERLAIHERGSRQPGARSCVEVGKVALRLQDVQPWPSTRRTIPPAAYRATFLLESTCDSAPSEARKTAGPAGDASALAEPPALVKVAAFDCDKLNVLPGQVPPRGLVPPGTGIRAWKGGGPHGSNWNVEDLRCVARATTSCTRGKVLFTLRAGQQVLAEKEETVSDGAADFEAVTPAAAWERGHDSPARAKMLKVPFKTVAFRVQAVLVCEAPTKASLNDWNYRFVAADDAFVAGFASGE
jgi:hypothetical protein